MSEMRIVTIAISCGYPETQEILEAMLEDANHRGDTNVDVLVNHKVDDDEH